MPNNYFSKDGDGHVAKGSLVMGVGEEGALGRRVRALREARGWSQIDLERATGGQVRQEAISRIERGQTTTPNVYDVAIIAKALGDTVEGLLTLADLPPQPQSAQEERAAIAQAVEKLSQAVERIAESQRAIAARVGRLEGGSAAESGPRDKA